MIAGGLKFKYSFGLKYITYLGYVITQKGIKHNQNKLRGIICIGLVPDITVHLIHTICYRGPAFPTTRGTMQGISVSLMQFNVLVDNVIRTWLDMTVENQRVDHDEL